jgi:hypothetical protein
VAVKGKMWNPKRILVGEFPGNHPLGRLKRWENNIKIDLHL